MSERSEYRITVKGRIDPRLCEWFGDMNATYGTAADGTEVTELEGMVRDQAALRGILARIWNLSLCVLSVERRKQ